MKWIVCRGHTAAVLCVQFDDRKIVSGSYDKTIKVRMCAKLYSLFAESWLSWLIELMLLGCEPLQVWSLDEGSCLMTLTGHHDAVTCLNLTFDGRKVISGSLDHNLKFWDLATGKVGYLCTLPIIILLFL